MPDWSSQPEEICCPLCDYNLRGLTEPRCPECGYQFEWANILDPTQRIHAYLFEHYPKRNIWSFVKTVLGSANPFAFWRSLHPYQPSNVRRLFLFWVLCVVIAVIPFLTAAVPFIADYPREVARSRSAELASLQKSYSMRTSVINQFGTVERYLDRLYPPINSKHFYLQLQNGLKRQPMLMLLPFLMLIWPWGTFLILLIFRQSMSRAKINIAHVMRCVLYSDGVLYAAFILTGPILLLVLLAMTNLPPGMTMEVHLSRMVVLFMKLSCLAAPILWMFAFWRLIVAYQRYLRFPHAVATIISTQIILFLAICCALLTWVT